MVSKQSANKVENETQTLSGQDLAPQTWGRQRGRGRLASSIACELMDPNEIVKRIPDALTIAALLSHRNVEEAARTAGVGTRTLLRWMKIPEFAADYREARRLAYGQSIARLQQASSAAATTLLKVMLDPTSPASTRVRAADSVLGHAAKAIEIEDIEARVAALEEATQNDGHRR